MGLCSRPVGFLAWGIPVLEPIGCWVGPGLGEKMAASRRAHANECSPELPLPVSFSPQWATAVPCLHRRPSNTAGRSGLGSYEVTAFFPGSWCTWDLVCTLQVWSLCSLSPMEFLWSNPIGLQSQILRGLLLPLLDPQAGEPAIWLRTFTLVGELLWHDYFPVCGSPTWQVWDLSLSWLCPSYFLVVASSSSLGVEYLFW